jgi:hypothetical protein
MYKNNTIITKLLKEIRRVQELKSDWATIFKDLPGGAERMQY